MSTINVQDVVTQAQSLELQVSYLKNFVRIGSPSNDKARIYLPKRKATSTIDISKFTVPGATDLGEEKSFGGVKQRLVMKEMDEDGAKSAVGTLLLALVDALK